MKYRKNTKNRENIWTTKLNNREKEDKKNTNKKLKEKIARERKHNALLRTAQYVRTYPFFAKDLIYSHE